MEPIDVFLGSAKVARRQDAGNLSVFPLLAVDVFQPEYLTLEQALDQGVIRIGEVSHQGRVPDLLLTNTGTTPVLVIQGEELAGAKQNRIVNASFLVGAKAEVVIPVSCVEQGRWHYEKTDFSSGRKMMNYSIRRTHQSVMACSLASGNGFVSDQGRIWDEIGAKSRRMRVDSPTGAMADVFDCYQDRLKEFTKGFNLIDCQVGAVFAVDGKVVGLEAFGCADTFALFFQKLVQSYAIDALETADKGAGKPAAPGRAKDFVAAVRQSERKAYPTLGLGATVVLICPKISGAALVENNRVLHLSALRKASGQGAHRIGFGRFSQRQGFRVLRGD
jgi:hypothetical protein